MKRRILQVNMSVFGAGAASLRTATSMEDLRGVCGEVGGSLFPDVREKEGLIFPLPFTPAAMKQRVPDAALRP